MAQGKSASNSGSVDAQSNENERWHELVSEIGAEIAGPLTAALERIHALIATGRIDRAGLRSLRDEVEQARQIGMIGQQLTRFASGRVRQSHERLHLADMLTGVLAHRARETQARGIALKPSLKPADVIVDASLLFSLLNTTIDWALANAHSFIEFTIDFKTWPVHARITCRFVHRPADQPGQETEVPPRLNSLAWRLLEQTAWTMGLVVERKDEDGNTTLVLEFPRTVNDDVQGVTASEIDDESTSTNSKALAGSHILVVASRRELRVEIRDALRNMSLLVDFVSSVKEAVNFCKEGLPHAVIIESIQLGERFNAFRDEILAEVPDFVFIEIVEEGSAFEMSGLNGATVARVGRAVIGSSLPAALMFELSKGL
ncbi:MAG: hypothetical protein M3Y67_03460 [Pseudomonadota bacterium]|nr:hypothetical protein [Pseudomonadota bacterium]